MPDLRRGLSTDSTCARLEAIDAGDLQLAASQSKALPQLTPRLDLPGHQERLRWLVPPRQPPNTTRKPGGRRMITHC